jgi:hypothetical protein
MAILWCGGEDLDFQNGFTPVPVATFASHFRAGYARCTICGSTSAVTYRSTNFGPITSGWFGVQNYINWPWNTAACIGLGKSNTNSGIFIGLGPNGRPAIVKKDAGAVTVLAEHAITGTGGINLVKMDMQVINYGASATVNVYWNGALFLTYTGNIAAAGVTDLDQIQVNNTGNYISEFSEAIVADEDTRLLGVVALAPNANGTTQQWTGAMTDVNETTINDATYNYTNITLQDQQYNLIDLPASNLVIKDLMITARAAGPTGSTASKILLGVKSGASIDAGSQQTVNPAWVTYSRHFGNIDPATGLPWTVAAINALQLNLRSG